MSRPTELKKLGIIPSFAIFLSAATGMFLLTRHLIPYLSEATGHETILFWFIVGGLGVFLPLLIVAVLLLRAEGFDLSKETWRHRMRFSKLTQRDVKWTLGGLLAIIILSGAILKALEFFIGDFDHSPPFMAFEPLSEGRYWLLAVWLPYWILNIMGEEILWRGVMLPRQEIAHGRHAWLIHGLGWGLFHISFGWQLMITLIPIIFIQSYVVQKTKNSWTGVIIHGGINGPSFIAISLGLI